jgi:hypothetical protein
MPERLRHERDGSALIDGMAGVGMPQPVGGNAQLDALT